MSPIDLCKEEAAGAGKGLALYDPRGYCGWWLLPWVPTFPPPMQRAVVYPCSVKNINASAEVPGLFLLLLLAVCPLYIVSFKISWKTLLKQAGNATEEAVSSGIKS